MLLAALILQYGAACRSRCERARTVPRHVVGSRWGEATARDERACAQPCSGCRR